MSIYTLPPMAEQRLASLVTHGGADTLQLQRPQNSLSVLVIAEHEHDKLQLSIGIGGQHSTLTLQAGDTLQLDWVDTGGAKRSDRASIQPA